MSGVPTDQTNKEFYQGLGETCHPWFPLKKKPHERASSSSIGKFISMEPVSFHLLVQYTSSTAQGGGGSFKIGKL